MRFEVPQFIEVEAKIVGPFTWKQFIYLAGGIGLLVVFYFTLPFAVFVLLGIPAGVLAGTLAFHKINNRPLSLFLESVVNYFLKKKLYLWRRDKVQNIIERTETYSSPAAKLEYTSKNTITTLSRNLEIHNPNQQ
jgi:hypothetical protein